MVDSISITSREEFEAWLDDKPVEWARVIALRAALRVFPLVFTVLDISDADLDHGRKQGLILHSWRAIFISSVAAVGPTDEMRRAAAAAYAAANAASNAAYAAAYAAANAAAAAYAAAADAAASNAAYAAADAAAADAAASNAAYAAADAAAANANASVIWDSVAADCGFLAGSRRIDEAAALLIRQPLWLADVRGSPRYLANFPDWSRQPFDGFVNADWVKDGAWALIVAWYRALLPDIHGSQPRNMFDNARGHELATQPDEFWKVTNDRSADDIMAEAAEILGWEPEVGPGWLERLATVEQLPDGLPIEAIDGELRIGASGTASDQDVAAAADTAGLHTAFQQTLTNLSASSARLDNREGWGDLAWPCRRLSEIVAEGPENVAANIKEAWALIVDLATFMEMDEAARSDTGSFVEPLDPQHRRRLNAALMIGAPYIRSFPTASQLDMEWTLFDKGEALVAYAILVVEKSRNAKLLNGDDATTLLSLLSAAQRGGAQAQKLQGVAVQTSRNVVIQSGKYLAALYVAASLGAATPNMQLMQPGIQFFTSLDDAVRILDDVPSVSLKLYVKLAEELEKNPPRLPTPPTSDGGRPWRKEDD